MYNKSYRSPAQKLQKDFQYVKKANNNMSIQNKLRRTYFQSDISILADIYCLRNSFSSSSILNYKKLFQSQSTPTLQKSKSFQSLRVTLDQLEDKVYNINANSFLKKPKLQTHAQNNLRQNEKLKSVRSQKKFLYMQQEQCKPSDRQSISTFSTSLCVSRPLTKLSQYINSCPQPLHIQKLCSNPYSYSNNQYYISQALRAINQKNSLIMQHISTSIKTFQQFEYNSNGSIEQKHLASIHAIKQFQAGFILEILPKDIGKKTLLIDLDQTLIHCYQNLAIETDLKLKMNIQGTKVELGINVRPYALTFLKRISKYFQIIIFTASHQTYANTILDELDPQKQIFSHRLYRQHCVVLENQLHVKDLRFLNRDLKNVVLVDNAPYSYIYQLQNGIPILPYYQGKDFELSALEKYLLSVVEVEDVRTKNRQYFQLQKYIQFENAQQLISKIYSSKSFYKDNRL